MTTEQEWARSVPRPNRRSTLASPSRAVNVKLGRVHGGFSVGLSRRVVPIFPAGRVVAWKVGLGVFQLTWGKVV